MIDHAVSYVNGHVHTNGMENFWSLLKRSIKGTYVSVEPFHLFRYLDEQAFRFNERKHKDGDKGRFWDGLSRCDQNRTLCGQNRTSVRSKLDCACFAEPERSEGGAKYALATFSVVCSALEKNFNS